MESAGGIPGRPIFINWVRIMYKDLRTRVKINGELSGEIKLERGTRQGCPLSPLLFALAIEPFAIRVRAAERIEGLRREGRDEKIALYADDVLLFLGDTETSLDAAMELVEEFGGISGISINWGKSALLLMDGRLTPARVQQTQLIVAEKIKYLGITMTKNPKHYIEDNLNPLLLKFKKKCEIWKKNSPINSW